MMRITYLVSMVMFVLLFSTRICSAEQIVWARGASHLGHECKPPKQSCQLAYVVSPNRRYAISVSRTRESLNVEAIEGSNHFSIPLAKEMDAEMEWFVQMEILWSPDSSAVSFSWNTTAISESSSIYIVQPNGVHSVDLSAMRTNFARKWPPCVGIKEHCVISTSGSDYNYLTVAWASSHVAVMMAEVPPSGSYGDNLGRVVGYEVDVKTGIILRTMSPREFKSRWQAKLGWNFDLTAAQGQ